MSYKDSVQGSYYSQFTNDEKIAYALNLSLAKITVDAFKSGYEWYNSPDLYEAINKQSILSKSVPSYNDIKNYYCIVTVNNVEYITNKTVDNILTYQGGFKLSELLGTNSDILTGSSNEYSNAPSGGDFDNGLCNKLPRQAFAFFVYWKNKLTGKGGNGSTDGSSGSGTWPDSDDSLSVKLTLNSGGSGDADRTYNSVLSNETLMDNLKDYKPLKIINPSFITGTITQTNGIPESLKPYVLKNVVINVGVPTISTWNGLSNSNNSDNIAFFNPLLTKSLNETYGYNGNGLGNGYWIRGTDNGRANIRPDYGSAAVGEGTMIFSSMTGFVLFFGVSNILTNSVGVSVINPPCVTALRYTGETFADGIISQGLTLPDNAVSNDKDLFIKTDDNTIHRFDGSGNIQENKKWVQLGGSSSSSSATSAISTNTSNISTNTYKLTGISYSDQTSAGTYDITGGNFGGVSSFYSNGNVQLIGGYDGVNSSGDVVVKQDNIERMRFTSSNIYIRTSDDNKLIIDDNETKDVVSMTFESQGFVLFKGVAGGVQPTKYDMILDRGDNFWSAFTNSRDWDCYNDSNKYDRNSTGATMFLQYYSHGDINMCNTGGNVTIGAGGTTAGYLCIGGSSPVYPIDIRFLGPNGNWSGTYATFKYNDTALQSSVSASEVGLKALSAIWADGVGFIASSDRRIKENIRDVPDDLSLKMLRALPVSYYDYKDKLINGVRSTIGFIAQEVKEIMPMAVSLQKNIIPNEMRNLDNFSWETITDEKGNETFKLIVNDLEDVSGNTKYRFYCSNQDLKEKQLEIENLENEPKSFIFEKKWENVFLYGKEVNDFHTIDKNKIFAMLFSATQQIDKNQIILQEKVASLEAENITLKARLDAIEAKLISAGI